jgi:hypothetical protein
MPGGIAVVLGTIPGGIGGIQVVAAGTSSQILLKSGVVNSLLLGTIHVL